VVTVTGGAVTGGAVVGVSTTSGVVAAFVVDTVEEVARSVVGSVDDGAPVVDESGTGAVVKVADCGGGAQPAIPATSSVATATDMHLVTVYLNRIVSRNTQASNPLPRGGSPPAIGNTTGHI
jgi:hypothetical protein